MDPSTLSVCKDEELLALIRKGKREAFGVLVRRYEGELYGYLRRYLGDAEPGAEYLCERIGLFGTTSVGRGRVRYRGVLQDPNELALAGGIGLPLAFALGGVPRRSLGRGMLVALTLALVLLCAVLTGSRSGQLVFVAVVNPFVAATIKRGERFQDEFSGQGSSLLSFSPEGVWLRQADPEGQTVIQAARTNADGTILSRVRMHRFDTEGTLYARIDAPAARLTPGAWVLENAVEWRLDAEGRFEQTAAEGRLNLPTALTSDEILESFAPPETVGFWDLGRFIAQMEESGFSGLRHRLFLQSELAKPALYAAMVLIGSAFALRPTRFGQTGVMILLAVLAGFALYFLKDFAETLGGRGQIPLIVAAWTPPVAAILLAISLLLHLEDG